MIKSRWIVGFAVSALFGWGNLFAQLEPGESGDVPRMPVPLRPDPNPFLPGEAVEGEPEYWEETVERAMENAGSENPEVRRSAVMLLGKYPVAQAQQAVVRALDDPDAGVRQAALVSLFETRRIYLGDVAEKIVERAGDSDAGIRRIASSVLPMVMQGFPLTMSPRENRPVRQLPRNLLSILQEAFLDEDTTVRRNMISNFSQLRVPIPEEVMAELLRDPDREVAIEALGAAATHFPGEFLAGEAAELVENPSRIFRLTLSRELARINHPSADEALGRLREDEDTEVRLEASVAFFRRSPTPDFYEELMGELEEVRGRHEVVINAIRSVTLLEGAAETFLQRWMKHPNPAFREEAIRIYFARFPDSVEDGKIIALLDEDEQIIRQVALRFLTQRSPRVSPAILEAAAASRHVDVRRAAVRFTRYTRTEASEEVLMELLLDDDRQVRVQALQEVGARQMEGWVDILVLSLRDSDSMIRQTALRGLFSEVNPETLERLRGFLNSHPDSPLAPSIRNHLARYETQIRESRLRTRP